MSVLKCYRCKSWPCSCKDGITLIHGDCREVLPQLEAGSVQLSANDPPYFKVKGEWWDRQWDKPEGFLEWLGGICCEWQRVLAPNGSLYTFASPQMAWSVEGVVREHFRVLTNIRWRKPPFSTKAEMFDKTELRAPFPASETILFCEQRGSDNGYNDAIIGENKTYWTACETAKRGIFGDYLRDEFKQAGVTNRQIAALFPSATGGLTGCVSNWLLGYNCPTPEQYERMREHLNGLNGSQYLRREYEYLRREYEDLRREYEDLRRPFNMDDKRPYTDVWDFPTVSAQGHPGKHPCEKPIAMMEHIVEVSSREGDLVLDCFAGSGTTGQACKDLKRRCLMIEIEEKYVRIAAERLRQEVFAFSE